MSAPLEIPDPAAATVMPLDDADQFILAPLIADILQTRVCIPGSIFLVEDIDQNIAVTTRYRAVRLLLGDGDLCIQALLHGDTHELVDSGNIYSGCYIKANKFELRSFNLGGSEKMAYLLVEDLSPMGRNETYLELITSSAQPSLGAEDIDTVAEPIESSSVTEAASEEEPAPSQEEFLHDSDLDDAFEVMDVSTHKATQRREEITRLRQETSQSASAQLPWTSSDPTQPLKLTPLRSVPNLPFKQNWTVNVLAVVISLSELEASNLAPNSWQRTARLADPSTGKRVLLTVFLRPEEFTPRVGSVVLLVGVKNHRFDGGSLKKYASDKPKHGVRWWFEEPYELAWCDVGGLRYWWDTKHGDGGA